MLSVGLDVRTYYRYTPKGLKTPNRGGAVTTWARSPKRYRLYFYPMENARGKEDFGYTNETYWRVIANDTTDFKLGDFIGEADKRRFEVQRVRTFRNQQQMEVREWPPM